jgi:hypothetical protein
VSVGPDLSKSHYLLIASSCEHGHISLGFIKFRGGIPWPAEQLTAFLEGTPFHIVSYEVCLVSKNVAI